MRVFDVLIVTSDDGMMAMLCRSVSAQPALRVSGRCTTPAEAEALARMAPPDVIALDMQLAGADCAVLIGKLTRISYAPIVAMSAVTGIALDTLNAGATDFVYIPERGSNSDYGSFLADAVDRIKIAAALGGKARPDYDGAAYAMQAASLAILIGAAGGPVPLAFCVSRMPSDGPALLAVQWQYGVFCSDLCAALSGMTGRKAVEGIDGMELECGGIYVVAGNSMVTVTVAEGNPVLRLGGPCRSRDEQAEALLTSAAALNIRISGALLFDSAAGENALKQMAARGHLAIKLNKNEILRDVGYKPAGGVVERPLEDIVAVMLS